MWYLVVSSDEDGGRRDKLCKVVALWHLNTFHCVAPFLFWNVLFSQQLLNKHTVSLTWLHVSSKFSVWTCCQSEQSHTKVLDWQISGDSAAVSVVKSADLRWADSHQPLWSPSDTRYTTDGLTSESTSLRSECLNVYLIRTHLCFNETLQRLLQQLSHVSCHWLVSMLKWTYRDTRLNLASVSQRL